MQKINKFKFAINYQIKSDLVRLVDDKKNVLIPLKEALEEAQQAGLDLVEISQNISPPICKLMDYPKFIYKKQKQESLARKSQKIVSIKDVQMRILIDEHDYQVRLKRALDFLKAKHKVRVLIVLRAKELQYKKQANEIINRFREDIGNKGVIDKNMSDEGKRLILIIRPV